MSHVLITYYIFTILISINNIYLACKINIEDELINAGIINDISPDKLSFIENVRLSIIIISFLYLVISSLVYVIVVDVQFFPALLWVVFLYIFNVCGIQFSIEKLSGSKSFQKYFIPNKIDVPKAVIDFKLDLYSISVNKSSLKYLRTYKYPETKKDQTYKLENIRETYLTINEIGSSSNNFPLLIGLLSLDELLKNNSPSSLSPKVSAYLLDNIAFLTTIMTIVNSKKLVLSLSSPEGLSELIDISKELYVFNMGLQKVINRIHDEKIRFKKSSESLDIIEGLNEVRSIREFSKSVK